MSPLIFIIMEDYKKKYKEALDNFKKIKAANKDNKELVDFIEYKYPELKESEDERIRKEIIQSIQDNMCVIHKDKCIAWLEKQGGQKPAWSEEDEKIIKELSNIIVANSKNNYLGHYYTPDLITKLQSLRHSSKLLNQEWSEEDEQMINDIIEAIDEQYDVSDYQEMVNWLKFIKERVQPWPKREWSKEEKARIDKIIDVLDWAEEKGRISYSDWEDYVCYVKSLRPQSTWKPSDEQMKALEYYMNVLNCNEHKEVLFGLYKQLKSL